MEDNTIFDDTLFSILRECKTLPTFFDTIFGFLNRRTDFYCLAAEPNSPVGLPPGWAEHFVKSAFFKWKPSETPTTCESSNKGSPDCLTTNSKKIYSLHETEVKSSKTSKSLTHDNFTTSESYNGSVFNNYTWSQTITDIDIIVKVPENVTSKNLSVTILPQKITVTVKNGDVILDGELYQKVKNTDAIWSFEKQRLEIHLDKSSEMWWNCLVQSEPKLDVSKIDCSRPLEDLPEEAQAKIEELAWNQERKRLGLPTSEELVIHEKLKKAWNVEGSPFKGAFDPNAVIINP